VAIFLNTNTVCESFLEKKKLGELTFLVGSITSHCSRMESMLFPEVMGEVFYQS